MADSSVTFDFFGFSRALDAVRVGRRLNWKQVSEATGVGASTLARMAKGKRPDADSLAALAAWSGVNPADFVPELNSPSLQPNTLADIYGCLRRDPNLSTEATDALDEIIKATYERLRKKE